MKKTVIATVGTVIATSFITMTCMPITTFAAGNVTLEQAKKIALENAGLKANEVTIVKEGMEIDDGRTQYEIEFYKDNTEYDYEIDAATGAIVSFDQEIETKYVTAAPKTGAAANAGVTKDQALQIALDHAGLNKNDIALKKVKKDFDDGVEVYEVEFYAGGYEYNYDIAVSGGQILDFDIDD